MPLRTLVLMCILVLSVGFRPAVSAQGSTNQLSLAVFFIEPPKAKTPTRLWLRITNGTPRAQILCRSSWGYTWLSDDPQEAPAIEEKSSLHGCGDDNHDPFWLLLPGESRFDSYEVTGPAGPNGPVKVDVDVMHRLADAPGPGDRVTLSWKGRLSDAIALGSKLRGR
jgi:hypothetical protein